MKDTVRTRYVMRARLGEARRAAGISWAKAATFLGVGEHAVKSIEKSDTPKFSTICRYADMLGVKPNDLLIVEEVEETVETELQPA